MGRKRNDEAILKVWYVLEEGPKTLGGIMSATGLSASAVRTALKHINHTMQAAEKQPIVVDRKTWQYLLPDDRADFWAWHLNRLQDAATRLNTEWQRAQAAAGKWKSRKQAKLGRRIEMLFDDIEDVIIETREMADRIA